MATIHTEQKTLFANVSLGPRRGIILYDARCPFCAGGARLLGRTRRYCMGGRCELRRDRRMRVGRLTRIWDL
jgi:hypothetical protein